MNLKAPAVCPVCSGEYEISKLTCKKCKSELTGHFDGCDFCKLNEEDTYFILTFLKCRGNIKDVEKELGISYPTVRGKLDAVIGRLGLKSTVSPDDIKNKRNQILKQLNNSEITADQAAELLKNI